MLANVSVEGTEPWWLVAGELDPKGAACSQVLRKGLSGQPGVPCRSLPLPVLLLTLQTTLLGSPAPSDRGLLSFSPGAWGTMPSVSGGAAQLDGSQFLALGLSAPPTPVAGAGGGGGSSWPLTLQL